MNITINKQTAKAIKKALFFTLSACFKHDSNELNKESMKVLGLSENEVFSLCNLHTKLNKAEKRKPANRKTNGD